MTLFFDRTSGKTIVQALKLLRLDVQGHGDHFDETTFDDTWLKHIGKKGWLAVTDDRLWHNASAMQALVDYGVGCFVIRGGANRPKWFTVRVLAKNWDHMVQLANNVPRPFLYRIYINRPAKRRDLPGPD